MIKYTKEEFPARFTVFEHTCEYCGIKFFSNRSKTKYDTGTCRTYANARKRAKNLDAPTVTPDTEKIKYDEKYFGKEHEAVEQVMDILGEEEQYVKAFFQYIQENPTNNTNKFTRIWDKETKRYADVKLYKGLFTVLAPVVDRFKGLSLK